MKQLRLEDMTTEQKLGFLFCARRWWNEDDIQFALDMIEKRALGCVQLHAHQTKTCGRILEAAKKADYPILVFNDTEMGFPTTTLPKVPLISLAACNDARYYRAFAKAIVRDAKAAGFNGTWGPVIDTNKGDGPCRVHRSFSDDPNKVAEAAAEIARVYRDNGYLSTGKHYPGGDGFPYDTHMTEGWSEMTEEELWSSNLIPYMRLHEQGLMPCVMSAHTVLHNIDPDYPASLSKKVIDIIRKWGYDGLMFTDSFAMMGVLQKYGEENIYGQAIAAGNDIVLPNFFTPTSECFEMLKKNYEDGVFSEERLNEAVSRVLKCQAFVASEPENPTEFTKEDEELYYSIAKDCITAVTDEGVSAALPDPEKKRLFIVLTENSFDPNSLQEAEDVGAENWYFPHRIAEKIRAEFPNAAVEFLPEFSGATENDRILRAATKFDEVVFVTFCTTTCYLGTDGLTRRTEAVINCLAHSGKVAAILHFGNPYALQYLREHIGRKIFGYLIPKSQEYAIDVLKGNIPAKGALPFKVELK